MPLADPEARKAYYREWKNKNAEKMREYNRVYQKENRATINAKHREWKAANPDSVKRDSARDYRRHKEKRQAKHREYEQKNKEKLSEYRGRWKRESEAAKKWRAKNQEKIRAYRRTCYLRYREAYRKFQNDYDTRTPRRLSIYRKYDLCGELCYICGLHLDIEDMQIDHVHPIGKNGGNDIQNLMPVHAQCNNRKGKRLDYPVARLDLVELAKCIQAVPRAKRKTKVAEYV